MVKIYLIDASPYIFRAYYSIPETMVTPDGRTINAVYGYTEFLIQILKREKPSHIAVTFDGSLTTSFRNEIYPDYKSNRPQPPAELEAQLELCRVVTSALGIHSYISDRYESDDLIGTLLTRLADSSHEFVVVSNDKDLMQFVGENVRFWDFAKDRLYEANDVLAKFGVRPDQLVDYLALTGDSVDNIPGIRGIGPKTAAALLNNYQTLDNIFANPEQVISLQIRGAKTVHSRLREGEEIARLSRKLVTIETEVPIETGLQQVRYSGWSPELIDPLFENLGFGGIKNRLPRLVEQR